MGICNFRKTYLEIKGFDEKSKDKPEENQNNNNKDNKDNKIKVKEDPLNINGVFEEIGDIEGFQIKGAMLGSESLGKPKDNYEMKENISPVSYGLIKKVQHKLTKKTRAMRIIKKELIEVKEDETLLFKELALLRTGDHPNIIKFYEFYRDEKFYYLVSEYCAEGALFDIIKQNPSGFNEYTVCDIMKQLLSVVSYCHCKKIVIRDLRPENIGVDYSEKQDVNGIEFTLYNIRVNDFRSSRSYSQSKKGNKKVGNPFYIAPEVLHRKYNEKCDVWSCGIIMYILLTGKPPMSGSTDKEIGDKVEQGKVFDFFDEDGENNSNDCKNLLRDLLKYDPNKRLSAQDAGKHKWFKLNTIDFKIDQNFIGDSYNSLMTYVPDVKFAQASGAYMVHNGSDNSMLCNIIKGFYYFDTNKNGKITYSECGDGFKRGLNQIIINDKEFLKVMKRIDPYKTGYFEFEEFVMIIIKKDILITEENLDITFRGFDKDGSGSIEPCEIKAILGGSANYSNKVWNEIGTHIEHENENEITCEEFKKMMMKTILGSRT